MLSGQLGWPGQELGAHRVHGLVGLATPELIGPHGLALTAAVLTWLIGAAVARLLRHPASTAFFKPLGSVPVPALI